MLAGLFCLGNKAKERRWRYSQYGNRFTLPRCSILNLQLVELTNIDPKIQGAAVEVQALRTESAELL